MADSEEEYDPGTDFEPVPAAPTGPPPAPAPAKDEMYDPFSNPNNDLGVFEDDDDDDDVDDAAEVALRQQAAEAMKRRDMTMSLRTKEVTCRVIFSPSLLAGR